MPNRNIASLQVDAKDIQRINDLLQAIEVFGEKGMGRIIELQGESAVKKMKRDAPVATARTQLEWEYDEIGRSAGNLQRKIEGAKEGKYNYIIFSEAIDPVSGEDYAPIQEQVNGTMPFRTKPYFWRNVRKFTYNVRDNLTKTLARILKSQGRGAKAAFGDLLER